MKQKITVHIKENSWFAIAAAKKMKAQHLAIVYNRTIHLFNTPKQLFLNDVAWVCHELQHVKQYQQQGSFIFLIKYIWYWARVGYYNIPYEIEARANENNLKLLDEYNII